VHEVAKTTTVALPVLVLATACLAKVGHWRKLGIKGPSSIPSIVEIINSGLGFRFPLVSRVDVTNQMVSNVVTHVQFQQVAELCEFAVQVLINSIKTFLELLVRQLADRVVRWVVVNIREENGLGEWRSNVFS